MSKSKLGWSLLIVLSLTCDISTAQAPQKPVVLATASMIADMAKQIAGDNVIIECIVPIGGDPHIYDPTPGDAQMIGKADLILRNGLTFEGWLNELIENSGGNAEVITVTDGIDPIASSVYDNAVDPHAWMDANRGLTYAKNIYEAIALLIPAQKTMLTQNYEAYLEQLRNTDRYIMEQIMTIPADRRVLITSHDAFQYYGRRYGLQLESVLGTSTDADVQTSDIVRLNKVIRAKKVPALFVESTINPKLLEQLASDNDIRVGGSLYADSLGDEDSPAPTYLAMLRHNTDVIVAALNRTLTDDTAHNAGEKPIAKDRNWTYLLLGGILLLVAIIAYFKFAT